MIGTSLYIIACTARNRIRLRLRRLREPRYLIGGIVGVAYFYFSLFRFRARPDETSARRRRGGGTAALAVLLGAGPSMLAILLSGMAAFTWLSPSPSGGLFEFSKAEVQFLLPAPVTRRGLLLHRLLRSQLGLLLAATIPMLLVPRGTGASRVRIGLAAWVILTTLRLVSAGVTLWRSRLAEREWRTRFLAALWLVLTAGPFLAIATLLVNGFWRVTGADVADILDRVNTLTRTGLAGWLLHPFVMLATPIFAPDWPTFVPTVASALVVFVAVGLWVFASDEALEAVSDTVVVGRDRISPVRTSRYQVRSTPLGLSPIGRPELLFFWKSATEATRAVNVRTVLGFAVAVLVGISAGAATGTLPRGAAETLGIMSTFAMSFALFVGPQVLRPDLRSDLEHLALLKTWPLPPAAVVRGELIWPVALLTAIVWALTILSVILAPTAAPSIRPVWLFVLAAGGILISPGIIAAQYVIHNASALVFPGWVTFGSQRPRGLDAMGQRLILMAGTWVALVVMTLPGALAGGLLWLVLGRVLGPPVFVLAALVCTAALLTETVMVAQALGPIYSRIDLTDIEPGE